MASLTVGVNLVRSMADVTVPARFKTTAMLACCHIKDNTALEDPFQQTTAAH